MTGTSTGHVIATVVVVVVVGGGRPLQAGVPAAVEVGHCQGWRGVIGWVSTRMQSDARYAARSLASCCARALWASASRACVLPRPPLVTCTAAPCRSG